MEQHTDRNTDRQWDIQTDIKTDRQKDRQTDRHTDRHTDIQTDVTIIILSNVRGAEATKRRVRGELRRETTGMLSKARSNAKTLKSIKSQ